MNRCPLPYDIFSALARRMGEKAVSQRLRMQVEHAASWFGKGFGRIHLENLDTFVNFVDCSLRISRMRERGRRNSLDFQTIKNDVNLEIEDTSHKSYKLNFKKGGELHMFRVTGKFRLTWNDDDVL